MKAGRCSISSQDLISSDNPEADAQSSVETLRYACRAASLDSSLMKSLREAVVRSLYMRKLCTR